MFAGVLAFVLRLASSSAVDAAIKHMNRRAELAGEEAVLRQKTEAELIRLYAAEAKAQGDLAKAKMQFPIFWAFAALFIAPLGLWWAAVIVDSVFGFSWDVADLPTPEMRTWAGQMIQWVFYTGTAAGAAKVILGR